MLGSCYLGNYYLGQTSSFSGFIEVLLEVGDAKLQTTCQQVLVNQLHNILVSNAKINNTPTNVLLKQLHYLDAMSADILTSASTPELVSVIVLLADAGLLKTNALQAILSQLHALQVPKTTIDTSSTVERLYQLHKLSGGDSMLDLVQTSIVKLIDWKKLGVEWGENFSAKDKEIGDYKESEAPMVAQVKRAEQSFGEFVKAKQDDSGSYKPKYKKDGIL